MAREMTVGLSLSLSGQFAAFGTQAEAALQLAVQQINQDGGVALKGEYRRLALRCIDDASSAARVREIYRELCFSNPCDLILGPYSSGLTRVAAAIAGEAGKLIVNHGGADDSLQSRDDGGIVSVLTPAAEYLTSFIRLLATLKFWRKRLAIAAARSPFASAVAAGIEREVRQRRIWLHGVRVRLRYRGALDDADTERALIRALRRNRINALVSVGSYEHDLELMRMASRPPLNIPVLGCVAAGVSRFRRELGDDAEGIVGPSQWERDFQNKPAIGMTSGAFARAIEAKCGACDYPAAQAYAAVWLTATALRRCGTLDQSRLRDAFSDLQTTTLFGDFAINRRTGRQIAHQMLLVQWHEGQKEIIEVEPRLAEDSLAMPSGWRRLLAPGDRLKLSRRD